MCGCGAAELDSDGDETADCADGCPSDGGKSAPGVCGCGVVTCAFDTDRTAYGDLELIDFSGLSPDPEQLDTSFPYGLTVQGVTFESSDRYLFVRAFDSTAYLYGIARDAGTRPTLRITLPSGTTRVGFDVGTGGEDPETRVEIVLSTGDVFVVDRTLDFFGVESSSPLAWIELSISEPPDLSDTILLDDFVFGQ